MGTKLLLRGSKVLPKVQSLVPTQAVRHLLYVASLISHLMPRSNICLLIDRFHISTNRNNGQPTKIGTNAMASYCLPCQLLCPTLYFTETETFCTEIRIRSGLVRPTGFFTHDPVRSGPVENF